LPTKDVIYLDESGFDSKITRDYARSKKGEKVIGTVSGKA